jgi:succinyl-CoA synthetase beta subunit
MKLYEYQVKELFKDAGIAIPKSQLIHRVEQASEAFEAIGFPCVIKSQVLSGGRGKAGLIQFVRDKQKGMEEVPACSHCHKKFLPYSSKKPLISHMKCMLLLPLIPSADQLCPSSVRPAE